MTYRTDNHWGVTIVREGDRTPEGHITGPDELVAVVVNGDQALAERICALLDSGHHEAIGLLGMARHLRRDGEDHILTWEKFDQACDEYMAWRQRTNACTCGHDGLDETFHTRPCPIAERRFARLRNTEKGA